MKKLTLLAFAAAICLTACNSPKEQAKSVTGTVYDATMNNIMLISDQGDTLDISTMNTDPEMVPGVLLEDSVQIDYMETTTKDNVMRQATKLTILKHSPYYYIQGTWLEPNPIAVDEVQGFTLNQDGTAASINMATLLFKNWSLDDLTLTMGYESVGNGQTIQGSSVYDVVKIDADSLVLKDKENAVVFRLSRKE